VNANNVILLQLTNVENAAQLVGRKHVKVGIIFAAKIYNFVPALVTRRHS